MPDPRDVAEEHYADRRRLIEAADRAAGGAWGRVDPDDILRSWLALLPEMLVAVSGAQLAAASSADEYVTEVLESQDIDATAAGAVAPRFFAGVASDGRPLATLLANPAVVALSAIQDGADVARALAAGRANLDMIVRTQLADAGRAADQVALVARPAATAYVRVAVGKTCARCLILAGRTYGWSAGFDRHPRDDCIHLPTDIARAGRLTQDPDDIYARMNPAERTRAGFTAADQKAIADGADMNQVVNAHRGLYTTVVGGQKIRATREGTSVRGTFGGFEIDPDTGRLRVRAGSELERRRSGSRSIRAAKAPRLTPEQIYRIAGDDRDEAVRLLRRNGYLVNRSVPAAPTRPRPALSPDLTPETAEALQRQMLAGQDWTPQQREALREYSDGWALEMNQLLRKGSGGGLFGAQFVRDAQAAMRPLPQAVTLHRFVHWDAFGVRSAAALKKLVGKTVQDRGFASTTIASSGWPDEQMRMGAGRTVRMEITAPAGTPAAYIESISAYPGQWEMLLGAGMKFRITAVTPSGKQTVVKVVIEP